MIRAPTAGRAAELVGRHRHQVGAEPVEVEGDVPGGGGRVDVDRHAEAAGSSSTTSATGWTVPTSWLAHWQWTSAGARPWSGRQRSMAVVHRLDLDPTQAVDGDGDHRAGPGRGIAHGGVLHRRSRPPARGRPGPRPTPRR